MPAGAKVQVELPTLLADHASGQHRIALQGETVLAVLQALGQAHPSLGELLWRDGELNAVLAVFVNQENITQLQRLDTPLADGDVVTVISALEGG